MGHLGVGARQGGAEDHGLPRGGTLRVLCICVGARQGGSEDHGLPRGGARPRLILHP